MFVAPHFFLMHIQKLAQSFHFAQISCVVFRAESWPAQMCAHCLARLCDMLRVDSCPVSSVLPR